MTRRDTMYDTKYDKIVEEGRVHFEGLKSVTEYLEASMLIGYVAGLPRELSHYHDLVEIYGNYKDWCEINGKPKAIKHNFVEIFHEQGYDKAAPKSQGGYYALDTPLPDWLDEALSLK
jgi:hypothetical protein